MTKHISVDMVNFEKHLDKFDIDFIRYFSRESLIANFSVTTYLTIIWLFSEMADFLMGVEFKVYTGIALLGIVFFTSALTAISLHAGNKLQNAVRMASNRLLFSLTSIIAATIFAAFASGKLTALDPFGKTMKIFMISFILAGATAVVLDLAVSVIKKKITGKKLKI